MKPTKSWMELSHSNCCFQPLVDNTSHFEGKVDMDLPRALEKWNCSSSQVGNPPYSSQITHSRIVSTLWAAVEMSCYLVREEGLKDMRS